MRSVTLNFTDWLKQSSDVRSDISFDILSDISSEILSDISFDILSDISSDILSDISFDMLSDILSDISKTKWRSHRLCRWLFVFAWRGFQVETRTVLLSLLLSLDLEIFQIWNGLDSSFLNFKRLRLESRVWGVDGVEKFRRVPRG